ncbi:MAG: DNA-directed RNA polymerase subunit beta [Bacilli bacterium]|nr:DNA-directed RNA polymerase subunit beta [Bacilli bacterium]
MGNSTQKITNGRLDFSKVSGSLELPYLVEIQTDSYDWFLKKGIDETLRDNFPITSNAGNLVIEYISSRLEQPKYPYLECKARNLTYGAKLRATLRLRFKETGEIKEHEVFMGDIPLMTQSGTFVINGSERVIISQIVRSPGSYMIDVGPDNKGNHLYRNDLIPSRGNYLQFENNAKNRLDVRINRLKKMPASVLLHAIGLEKSTDILDLFGKSPALMNTLSEDKDTPSVVALTEIFHKLKPGEPTTQEGVHNFLIQTFFDARRYDLGRAGRFKLTQKLGVYNRLLGRVLAENLVSASGEIKFEKGHEITKEDIKELQNEEFFERGAHQIRLHTNDKLDKHSCVNLVKVYLNDKQDKIAHIVGVDLNLTESRITISDICATFSYFLNILEGIGSCDDIDNLSNRRIRCVGELLQSQFRVGLAMMSKTIQQKMQISETENITVQSLINIKPINSAVHEFFASSQLSSFMDQTNPLAELTNKRRLSALGPGGIARDRAVGEVRDVHYTHYGRICPIETPEGQTIGLINSLASYAKINKYGFIETPYRHVYHKDGKHIVSDDSEYLSADQERDYVISEANVTLNEKGEILDEYVVARHNGENILAAASELDYIDVSPKQIVSVAAACIPFLESDDTTRALMGANMQRQALPLLRPEAPYVGTGIESRIARDSGLAVVAVKPGKVTYVDSQKIMVKEAKETRTYQLQKFERSNKGTCINQQAIVKVGDEIKAQQIIADGPAMQNGDLALGQNVTIAFMTWNGYNYEDAVIMSERLVKDDTYTSIHIEKYEIDCRSTKLGDEEITREVPNVGEEAKKYLDENGIITVGAEVKEGDILVGKTTPRGLSEPTPEEKFYMAIFSEKSREGKDTSLRVPHGGAGIVMDVKVFSRKNKDELPPGVNMSIKVYVAQKRKISEGDKMSGRHGNKGVISRILPVEDMPFLPDGTPIDIMLNPLGVPSRMNIGQILEIHLGLACRKLGLKIATPVFDGIDDKKIRELMDKANIAKDGKTILYDGRTGERFDERISVGVMYMIKLDHMVDDKLHARATGPYSLVTQQPLGGKAQNGGQRFGEMEVWALEAYGAAHTLQEILTVKSDDRVGRNKTYEAIIKQNELPQAGLPEAYRVLTKELQALCIDVKLLSKDGTPIDMDALAREVQQEERKTSSLIHNLTSEQATNSTSVSKEDIDEQLN